MDRDIPPGWSYNPSAWSERWPVLALALAGCGIATYLTLYQVHILSTVWEPFFGNGSTLILRKSAIAHLLPVPDASLGAFVYFLDVVADSIGGHDRWRSKPWAVLLLGLISTGLGFVGVLLAIFQPVLFGAYCTLCLGSAICSVLMVGAVLDEVLASLQHLARQHARGVSWWHALLGHTAPSSPHGRAAALS
jgi:uncharacterized membrane protein